MLLARSAAAQTAGHVVFTRADIQAAGWQRISEILDAAPGWRVTSTDGFTITPTADGLPAPGASGPAIPALTVIVDGARVPVSMLGQQELEFVPVLLAQLDSVVLTTAPRLVGSRIETRGTIEFFSHQPTRGASAQGEFQVGDVANKPGLYKYTPLQPFNREHHGPFHHLLFGYGGSRAGMEVGYRFATLNTTDSLILARTRGGVTVGTAQINLAAPIVHLSLEAFGGHHSVDATRAHYSGLFFVPAFGHEQALRMYGTSITAGGNAALPGATDLTYSSGYSADDVIPLYSPSPSTVTHRRQNLGAAVDVSRALGSARATLGAAADRWTLDRFRAGQSAARTEERLSARLEAPATDRWANSVAATATHSDGATRLGGLFSSRIAVAERSVFAFRAAYTSEGGVENGVWIDPYLLSGRVPTAVRHTTLGDASWTYTTSHAIDLLAGAGLRSVSGWPIASPSDTGYFELRGVVPPDPTLRTVQVATARIGVESRRTGRWNARIVYSYSGSLGADTIVRNATRSVARHQVNGNAWFVPARDWRIVTVVQAVSPTHWAAFPSIYGGWPPDVPGFSRIDLGAEKWMWNRRLRFQYLVRDVLNESERWQPRSAQFNLRYVISASFVAGFRD